MSPGGARPQVPQCTCRSEADAAVSCFSSLPPRFQSVMGPTVMRMCYQDSNARMQEGGGKTGVTLAVFPRLAHSRELQTPRGFYKALRFALAGRTSVSASRIKCIRWRVACSSAERFKSRTSSLRLIYPLWSIQGACGVLTSYVLSKARCLPQRAQYRKRQSARRPDGRRQVYRMVQLARGALG